MSRALHPCEIILFLKIMSKYFDLRLHSVINFDHNNYSNQFTDKAKFFFTKIIMSKYWQCVLAINLIHDLDKIKSIMLSLSNFQ